MSTLFARGQFVTGATTAERNHAQLWIPKAANKVLHLRRLVIGTTGGWEGVMSSTRCGNRPYGSSPKPDGISLDGTFTPSAGGEIRDQRSVAVEGGQMFDGYGSSVMVFGPGELVISPNWADATETGGSLMVRSSGNLSLWIGWFWEEHPRP